MSKANEIVVWGRTTGGKTARMGRRTAAHLDNTIARLKRVHPHAKLHVIQSAYNTGVAASAGTHDKDRCLDVWIEGLGWWAAQRFLRESGWAAWYRFPPTFGHHLHIISLGGDGPVGIFVPGQIDDYRRHALGLKGQHNSGADHSWFPPSIDKTIFNYSAYLKRQAEAKRKAAAKEAAEKKARAARKAKAAAKAKAARVAAAKKKAAAAAASKKAAAAKAAAAKAALQKPVKLQFDFGLMPSLKKLTPALFAADGKETGTLLGLDGVLFATELATNAQRNAVLKGLGEGWVAVHENECAQFLGSEWKVVKSYSKVLHSGLAGTSPTRVLNVTFAQHVSGGPVIAFVSTHLVSEAWCVHKKATKEWRQDRWNVSWVKIVAEVSTLVKDGYPVVFAGDLNTGVKKPAKDLRLHKDAEHVVAASLDSIFLVSTPDVHLSASGHKVVDINSDHNFHKLTVTVR